MTEDEVATQREGADGRSPLPRSSPSAGVVLNAQALLQADGGEPGMVAIGDLEIRVLRFMLCGSTGGTSRYRRRLWASSTLVMALSVGWMVVAATPPGGHRAVQGLSRRGLLRSSGLDFLRLGGD